MRNKINEIIKKINEKEIRSITVESNHNYNTIPINDENRNKLNISTRIGDFDDEWFFQIKYENFNLILLDIREIEEINVENVLDDLEIRIQDTEGNDEIKIEIEY